MDPCLLNSSTVCTSLHWPAACRFGLGCLAVPAAVNGHGSRSWARPARGKGGGAMQPPEGSMKLANSSCTPPDSLASLGQLSFSSRSVSLTCSNLTHLVPCSDFLDHITVMPAGPRAPVARAMHEPHSRIGANQCLRFSECLGTPRNLCTTGCLTITFCTGDSQSISTLSLVQHFCFTTAMSQRFVVCCTSSAQLQLTEKKPAAQQPVSSPYTSFS